MSKLSKLCYALAQEHTPVLICSASDYQQSDNYYDLLAQIFILAVQAESSEEIDPQLFVYLDQEQDHESVH